MATRVLLVLALVVYMVAAPVSVRAQGAAVAFVRGAADTAAWKDTDGVFTDLQAAIDAVAAEGGGQVRVARGVYAPAEGGAFTLRSNVLVTGGFSGNEQGDMPEFRMDADPHNHTILRSSGGNVLRHSEDAAPDATAVLENVTITGARGYSAVYNSGASPSFVNVIFVDNEAPHGAAMANFFSAPTIFESEFLGNSSRLGGGAIYNFASSPEIRDSQFFRNHSAGPGGAMLNEASAPTLINTEFGENTAQGEGGAIHSIDASHPLFNNTRFVRNTSEKYGGALSSDEGSLALYSAMFSGNKALFGGGLHLRSTEANIVNASFYSNTAQHGGAAYADNSQANFINAYFFRNTSDMNGGAIHSFVSAVKTLNSHFLENKAVGNGGGIFNSGGNVLTLNSLFVRNSTEGDGGAIFGESAASADSRLEMLNSTVANNFSAGNGAGIASQDYYKAVVNSIISGNRGEDFHAAQGEVFRNSIVGEAFFDEDGVSRDVGFEVDTHLDADFIPIAATPDNPAVGMGNSQVFNDFFSALTAQMGQGGPIRAYDLMGAARISGSKIDLGAFESTGQSPEFVLPAPNVRAHTGTGRSAGGKVNSSVYLSAWMDVTEIDNFPMVRRNGFIPFDIYVEDKYGQELYSGLKIEYNSGEYSFWASLVGAADSPRVGIALDIERGGPSVAGVVFEGGADHTAVPVTAASIELEFAGDVRSGGADSQIALFVLESEGDGTERELQLLNLSRNFSVVGNRIIIDISGARLRYSQKYRLQVDGMQDSFGNRMDTFSLDFVTQVSPDMYEPTITSLLSSVNTLSSEGGLADIIVAGGNLGSFSEILVTHNDLTGRAVVREDGTAAFARGIFIPPNNTENPIKYTFGVLGDGVDQGKRLSILVEGTKQGGGEATGQPVFSGEVLGELPAGAAEMPARLELVANGLPLGIDLGNGEAVVVSLSTVGGEAVVVVPYAELEKIREASPHFAIKLDTPLGRLEIPADTGGIVDDMRNILRDSAMSAQDIYLRFGLRDAAGDERLAALLEGFVIYGRPVGMFAEVVGSGGKVLRSVDEASGDMTLMLPLPMGGVLSGYSSVYVVGAQHLRGRQDVRPAFVPNTLADEDGSRFIKVSTPTTGVFFIGESGDYEVSDEDEWYRMDGRVLSQAAALGIISGEGDGNLEPRRIVTRGEFAQMTANALGLRGDAGELPFVDIEADDWRAASLYQLHTRGFLGVFSGSMFRPEDPLTREEAAAMMSSVLMSQPNAPKDFAPLQTALPWEGFGDYADFENQGHKEARLMVRLGIMHGTAAENFVPTGNMTREEAAAALIKVMRAIGNII